MHWAETETLTRRERESESEGSDQASDDRSPTGEGQIYDQPDPEVDFGRDTIGRLH